MPARRVLARGYFRHLSVVCKRVFSGRNAVKRDDVRNAERAEKWNFERRAVAVHHLCDVPKRVAAFIAEICCIGQLAHADAVENDQKNSFELSHMYMIPRIGLYLQTG